MVVVDVDHPDIEQFIEWKVIEEQKVAALVAGSKRLQPPPQPPSSAPARPRLDGDERFDPRKNRELRLAIKARAAP
jgi:ribonucleoside-diphosphate reductase alpha chain